MPEVRGIRRRATQRRWHCLAALPLVAAAAVALLGCRANKVAYPPPAPSPSAAPEGYVPPATPTRTPSPTATIGAATAAMFTPTPAPVVLSRQAAESQVLGWSILEGEARAERSAYIMPAALFAALPTDRAELWLNGSPYGDGYSPLNDTADPAHPLIMIEVSQRGMDLLGHENFGNADEAEMCEPVPRSQRYSYTGFFDAATGEYLGHTFEALPETAWQRASAEFPVPVVESTATATETSLIGPAPDWTPLPTATVVQYLSGIETRTPLSEGEIPSALSAMADVLPWVKGSRWTYRLTRVAAGARWSAATLTETVVSAEELAPDVVQVRREFAPRSDDYTATPWGKISWRELPESYLLPASVVTGFDGRPPMALADLRRAVLAPIPRKMRDEAGVIEMLRLPVRVGDEYNYWWHADKQEDVTVPAGTFRSCFALVEIVGGGNTWAHWLCPGVGFVRHELPMCGGSYGAYEVWELVDYEIPAITTTGGG